MKKRILPLALALLLCLGLTAPALAATKTATPPEIEVTWVDGYSIDNMGDAFYISELNWLAVDGDPDFVLDLTTGKEVARYEFAYPAGEGMVGVLVGDALGFLDSTGEEILPPKYGAAHSGASFFFDGVAIVGDYDTEKYVCIDKTGKVLFETDCYVGDFHDGLAAIREGDWQTGKWGYIDKTGAVVLSPEYDGAEHFYEGLARVYKEDAEGNRKYGYIDKTGAVVVPLEYNSVSSFSEGLAQVSKEDAEGHRKYGYIDKTGAVVVPLEYNSASSFSEGLAQVSKFDAEGNWKYGYIDKTGAVVIPLEYDDAANFSEGLAAICEGGKWGFIDNTGSKVIRCKYDDVLGSDFDGVEGFCAGLAVIMTRSNDVSYRYSLIDKDGQRLDLGSGLEYDYIAPLMCSWNQKNEFWDCGPWYVVIAENRIGVFCSPYWTSENTGEGGFPVLPVALAVVAVVVVAAIVIVLMLKKKKPSPEMANVPPVEKAQPSRPATPPERPPVRETPPASGPKFCPNCGKPLTPGVKFCPECGKPLTGGEG